MGSEEVIVEYRGYLLIQTVQTGTDRILRPDGTWRYSEPSDSGYGVGWLIGKLKVSGEI